METAYEENFDQEAHDIGWDDLANTLYERLIPLLQREMDLPGTFWRVELRDVLSGDRAAIAHLVAHCEKRRAG
jgi:hypothetical protein